MSSAASAGNRAFGIDRGLPFPLADIEQHRRARAGRLQPRRDHAAGRAPPRPAARARRPASSSIDPRRTPTADRADLLLQPVPGTDLALALGLLHLLVAAGAVDEDVRRRADDRLGRRAPDSVAAWWPERVERVTGVPAAELRALAALLGGRRDGHGADRPRRRAARAGHRHRAAPGSTSRSRSGMPGKPCAGYGCLTGQGNGQGGREHGQKADQLPGYRMIDDPAARAHVAGVWGVDPDDAARQGALGVRAARRARHRRRPEGAAGVRLATSWSPRPTPTHVADAARRRSTCWSSPTRAVARPRRSPTSCCR